MDPSPPYGAESGLSASRTAPRPYGRRFGCVARGRTDEGRAHVPPFWHDGTERPIHRPTDPEDQQEYYSGKKPCHTAVASTKIWAFRAFYATISPSSNRRKNRVGVNSPHLRKRPIV